VVDARAEQLRQLGGQLLGDPGRMIRRGGEQADHDDAVLPVGALLVPVTQVLTHLAPRIAALDHGVPAR
jgi:hypothetical protein